MHVHYVRTVPCIVQEIEGCYFDHYDDFELAEVLQDQETVYQSLKNRKTDGAEPSSRSESGQDHRLTETASVSLLQESINIKSQLELDEAMARALQDVENQFSVTSLDMVGTDLGSSKNQVSTSTTGSASSEPVTRDEIDLHLEREDDMDPDNMTYEELQSLGEAIGSESKGLPDELISYLPTSRYKAGFFSRKDKIECVICCMAYKNRDVLITLPCKHEYHSKCITKWLKINKVCPVCNKEVFG